jgi:hypothetical protein
MPFISTGSGGNKVVPFFGGGQVPNPANVIQRAGAPGSAGVDNALGTLYINTSTDIIYALVDKTAGVATWAILGGASGAVATLTGGSGGAISPSSGNITLAGTANQISTVGSGSTITWSLPSAITAPGSFLATTSVASTTTMTAGTGLTVTTGDITATNGNYISSAAGKGVSFNLVTNSGAASGTVNCNGRVGSVTFTSVSIASNADLSLVIGNTSITGASTRVLYTMSGATTGSGLSIKSITNAAGTSTIVVTNANAVGVVTSVADIVFDFIVLN